MNLTTLTPWRHWEALEHRWRRRQARRLLARAEAMADAWAQDFPRGKVMVDIPPRERLVWECCVHLAAADLNRQRSWPRVRAWSARLAKWAIKWWRPALRVTHRSRTQWELERDWGRALDRVGRNGPWVGADKRTADMLPWENRA